MEERIRALEDALAIAQAQDSDKPHTLLSTPWKVDDDEEEPSAPHEPTEPGLEDLVGTLGTLHIDEKAKTVQFFGPSGGTEVSTFRNGNHIATSHHLFNTECPFGKILSIYDLTINSLLDRITMETRGIPLLPQRRILLPRICVH